MPSLPEPASDLPRAARAWLREHLVLALAVVAVVGAIAVRALLPVAIEGALPWAARRWMGAHLEVEDVDLGLLAGSLTVAGLRLAPMAGDDVVQPKLDPDTALLGFDRLHLELRWGELLSRRVHLDVLEIDRPRGRLQQLADASFALPQPPASSPEAPPPVSPEPEGPGWNFAIDRLDLHDLGFELYAFGADEAVLGLAFDTLELSDLAFGGEANGLGNVSLRRPNLHVSREWLFTPTKATANSREASPPEPRGAEGAAFAIAHLAIESAGFSVRTTRGPVEAGLRLEARDASLAPGHVFPIEAELILGEGRIEVDGRVGADPVFFEGGVSWNELRVPPLLAALHPSLLLWLRSCNASGHADVLVRSQEAPGAPSGITLAGEARVDDFALVDPESADLAVSWQHFEIGLREAHLSLTGSAAPRFDIEQLAFVAPQVVVVTPSQALERLQAALSPDNTGASEADAQSASPEPPPEATAGAEPPLESTPGVELRIGALTVGSGSVQLGDRSVTPLHETRLDDVKIEARGLAWPERNLEELRFDARVQETASVSLRGALAAGDGRIDLDLSDLELVPYDGFAQRVGWRIAAGRGSLETSLRLQGDSFAADNELLLHDLGIDSDDPNVFVKQVGVPLDVALALLRNPKGDIALQIPVRGRAGQIGVGLTKVVRNAVLAAIKGALTSPLKLLGAAIPNGAAPVASFDLVAFPPGSSEIDAEVRDRVEPIARLLSERPKLALALSGRAAPGDTAPLAEQALRERAAAGEDLPDVAADGFFARRRVESALRQRAEGKAGELAAEDQAILERAVAAQPVSAAQRRELANARSEALRQALIGAGAPPEALLLEGPGEADVPGVALALRSRSAAE